MQGAKPLLNFLAAGQPGTSPPFTVARALPTENEIVPSPLKSARGMLLAGFPLEILRGVRLAPTMYIAAPPGPRTTILSLPSLSRNTDGLLTQGEACGGRAWRAV